MSIRACRWSQAGSELYLLLALISRGDSLSSTARSKWNFTPRSSSALLDGPRGCQVELAPHVNSCVSLVSSGE